MNHGVWMLSLAATWLLSEPLQAQPRSDVNFAVGGATTSAVNGTDTFAQQDEELAQLLAGVRAAGLDVIGLAQQLDWASATLNDVDSERDVFWLYAGANNYLAGGQDPSMAPADLGAALERLYVELGARRFVVPNLPALGDAPLFLQQSKEVQAGVNALVDAHNQGLADEVASFLSEHEDASVVELDIHGQFEDIKTSGAFAVIDEACTAVVAPEQLTTPGACDGYLFLDLVHPASAAWAAAAADAMEGLGDYPVDRVIALGDSLSDLGALADTFQRAVEVTFPPAPFTEGRFTEAANVIQQLEDQLETSVRTTFFAQPYVREETFKRRGVSEVSGRVYVPKEVHVRDPGRRGVVRLRFQVGCRVTECRYKRTEGDDAGRFTLKRCGRRVQGGDLLDVERIEVRGARGARGVTVKWLHRD